MSAPFSPGSADSTSDSIELDGSTPSSANPTPTGETSCELGGPESPSTRTWHKSHRGTREEADIWNETELAPTLNSMDLRYPTNPPFLISSAADSPAKTSPSPDDAKDSPVTAPASSTSSPESLSLFDPAGYSLRTFLGCSPRTAVGTSESCLERWPTSGMAWPGGLSTAVTSECRSDADGCSSSEPSLSEILEPPHNVPVKYSLSARAAIGILRRAEKRGRVLPPHLLRALTTVASLDP